MVSSIAMVEIRDWLRNEARSARNPADLLTRFGERLLGIDLPIASMTLEITTLHPLMAGSTLEWRRDRAVALEMPKFHHPFGADFGPPIGSAAAEADKPDVLDHLPFVISFSDGSRHRLTVVAAGRSGFSDADADLLRGLADALAAPLEIQVLKQVTRTLMTTYLGPRTADQVLSGAIRRGDCDSVQAVLWYSDLRDFTVLSQNLSGDAVIALLNSHFERLAAPIRAFGGEVLKFMGDGLLAIFPIDAAGSARHACRQAIKAVRGARAGMASLDGERQGRGEPALAFGVALHIGEVMYGNIGAPDRLDFTVIGPTVNLASRLEACCKPLRCPVLMSDAFETASDEALMSLGSHHLPDIADPVEVFTLGEVETAGQRRSNARRHA